MSLVHVCLNFKNKSGKTFLYGVDNAFVGNSCKRGSGHFKEGFEERLNAESSECASEEDGAQSAVLNCFHVKIATCTEKFNVVANLFPTAFAEIIGDLGVVELDFNGRGFSAFAFVSEEKNAFLFAVINALEFLAGTDGPVHGIGVDSKFALDFFAKVKGVFGVAVHFVDKGEYRNMAHGTDFEEFSGLGLNALCAVDDHYRRVRSHKGAVSVFGKILMSGGIKNVDAKSAVLELHYGGGYGNSALLFNFHPVGGCGFCFFAFDFACLGNCAAVKQEFFGKGGFTCVRVRNYRKSPAARNFFL